MNERRVGFVLTAGTLAVGLAAGLGSHGRWLQNFSAAALTFAVLGFCLDRFLRNTILFIDIVVAVAVGTLVFLSCDIELTLPTALASFFLLRLTHRSMAIGQWVGIGIGIVVLLASFSVAGMFGLIGIPVIAGYLLLASVEEEKESRARLDRQ